MKHGITTKHFCVLTRRGYYISGPVSNLTGISRSPRIESHGGIQKYVEIQTLLVRVLRIIARTCWNLRQFSKRVTFQKETSFRLVPIFEPGTFVSWDYRPIIWVIVVQRSRLNVRNDRVKIHVLFSILDGSSAPVTCSCGTTKRVSQGLEHGLNSYASEMVFFVSMRIKKKSEFSVSRSYFDSRCKPGVSCSWMEFDFCFTIENSRSFKTVICSTNSSSHCLSRDAEHIRLTAFRWRCDEVEMRGTCLETEKSMQTKVVINSWKLYYDTENTFTRNRTKGFFDIRRNEKVLP